MSVSPEAGRTELVRRFQPKGRSGKDRRGRNGISVGHAVNVLGQKDLKSLSTHRT